MKNTQKTTITVTKDVAMQIKVEAAKRYMTIAEYIEFMLVHTPRSK